MTFQPSATSTNGTPASLFIMSPSTTLSVGLLMSPTFTPFSCKPDDRIERAIYRLAHRDDIAAAGRRLAHDVILARLERLALVERLAVLVEDVRNGGARGEHESQTGILEDALHAGRELVLIDGKVQARRVLAVRRA